MKTTSSPWIIRSFAIPGLKRRQETPGQDAAIAVSLGGDCACLIVADGLSSARHGALGAKLITELLAKESISVLLSKRSLNPETLIIRAREPWESHITREGESVTDYATTVAIALLTSQTCMFAGIGDCFGLLRRRGDDSQLYAVFDQGKSASEDPFNLTPSLVSVDWRASIRTVVVEDPMVDGVLLSTDGLEDVALNYQVKPIQGSQPQTLYIHSVYPGTVTALLKHGPSRSAEELAAVIVSTESVMRSKMDDIGVALATRR